MTERRAHREDAAVECELSLKLTARGRDGATELQRRQLEQLAFRVGVVTSAANTR